MKDIAAKTYDGQCLQEFSVLYEHLKPYFVSIKTGCPYEKEKLATFHQASFSSLSDRGMELFLSAGYRRNGDCLYSMQCEDCQACIPIRLQPRRFQANRNQRRCIKRNSDLVVELLPLQVNEENLRLCDKFLTHRYPRENNTAAGYFHDFFCTSTTCCVQVQFRFEKRLLGTSVVDVGRNWLNAVYFFFDPEEHLRSLGTYNILYLLDLCLEWGVEYLYLGYVIDDLRSMNYKRNFMPHSVYQNGKWLECVKRHR